MQGLNALALGRVLTEESDHIAAGPLLREGLLSLHSVGDKWALALAFHALGIDRLRQGEPLPAIRLFAASAALLTAIGMNQLTEANAYIDELRRHLEAGAFRTAWEEGQNMKMETAVAYALEAIDGGQSDLTDSDSVR